MQRELADVPGWKAEHMSQALSSQVGGERRGGKRERRQEGGRREGERA